MGPNISEGKYALGALTVFAVWLFVGLPWLLTSQWGLSDKIAVIASAAALLQFVVLLATVWVMIVNGRRQLRAYVVVQSAEFIEQGEKRREKFVHYISLLNSGQTPAYKLTVRSATRVLPYPMESDFDFTLPSGANPSAMMIGPGGNVSHISEGEKVYSAAELKEFQGIGCKRRLYTYGSVEYTDAFQIPRFSNFCYILEWTNVHATGHTVSCQATEHHNEAN